MKSGTINKIKFKQLRQTLALPEWQAIGLLESIWQATYANAPAGDLGRLSNADIATSIGWTEDPDRLVDALVESRWLDRDAVHRLVVHDWEEHCASWLRANFARYGQEFAKPSPASAEEVHSSCIAPSPSNTTNVPPYLTIPNHTNQTTPNDASASRVRVFRKPSVEDVAALCQEKSYGIDPQDFIDHYETVGWVVGKNHSPMRDWKAAVRTWVSKRKKEQVASRVVTAEEFEDMHVDLMTGATR